MLYYFFYLPFTTMAWGMLGHRIVGQIADSYLTPTAKNAINKILGTESIAMTSNWPDFIKSDTSFAYLSPWHYINIKTGMTMEEVNDFLDKDTAVDAYTKINFLVGATKKQKAIGFKQSILFAAPGAYCRRCTPAIARWAAG